jgi:hypothetical protein
VTDDLLLIGGRSGVGKTSVAAELHELLAAHSVRHVLVEGDTLDLAWPWPEGLAFRNLADLWRNYTALGYHRLIYTNTNSVFDADEVVSAVGGHPRVTAVLLTASDPTIRTRLAQREIGTALDEHVSRSRIAATRLSAAPSWVVRVDTDDRPTPAVAHELATLTGWLPADS